MTRRSPITALRFAFLLTREQLLSLVVLNGGLDEGLKQTLGVVWPGLELWVILSGHEELLVRQFDHLDQVAVRVDPRDNQTVVLHLLAVVVVELVTVTVPFTDH